MEDQLKKTLDAAQADIERIRRSLAEVRMPGGEGPRGTPQTIAEPQLEDIKLGMTPETRDAVLKRLREVLSQ